MSPRRTRSQTKATNTHTNSPNIEALTLDKLNVSAPVNAGASQLPTTLTRAITGLESNDHKTLLRKQTWLQSHSLDVPKYFTKHKGALDATLVFAQEEAGTAVCIAPTGLLLTCSHCVAETVDELDKSKKHWLIFRSGVAVKASCVAWDGTRDLALLQVDAAQPGDQDGSFPFVPLGTKSLALNAHLVCVGHPGSEFLEPSQLGMKTNYDVLHVSAGRFYGCAEGQDPQDNSEIGALMHDCWTYWGHSGAPLLETKTGKLVGLHSSWDDEAAMRRGIMLEAILQFLDEHKVPFIID
ncbi:trypsin-like cysteine/serine peptidase domain-containing protein [Astrocystis sublimbata]|nr:trypsin-like cysteine/serine peptidase domain-containing protein [Astrocystis sublimbata]